MSSDGEPIVRVDNLTHRYAGADGRLALDGLTLSVQPGEIFGILGPNGSGKTTLFRILSTLIPTAPGHAFVLGHDVANDRDFVRRHIGVVFQSPSLDKQLTAEENLVHQGHLYGLRGAQLRERIAEGLKAVALGERAGERVGTFSGGMRRRVEVAKGLLHRPQVLLMDEPSTGIDPSARIDMWTQLRAVRDAGVTVLLTTHLMEEAEHCTRLAIMADGKLLACDTPAALKQRIGGDVIMVSSRSPDQLQQTPSAWSASAATNGCPA
jgi:ABC-2 type transport system ATP-binding protein